MIIDWYFVLEIIPVLLKAAIVTLKATITAYILALILGLFLALLRRSRNFIIYVPVIFFIEFIRSTPVLVQLFFMYFVFPEFGFRLSPLMTGILGLGIHYSCYLSEVYRSGLESIPKSQWEASKALNFNKTRTYANIIIPQAIPPIIPALGNYLIGMIKDTPLLSAIAVVEIMQQAKIIGSETFRYLEPITLVGIFFLVLSLIFAFLIRKIENFFVIENKI